MLIAELEDGNFARAQILNPPSGESYYIGTIYPSIQDASDKTNPNPHSPGSVWDTNGKAKFCFADGTSQDFKEKPCG